MNGNRKYKGKRRGRKPELLLKCAEVIQKHARTGITIKEMAKELYGSSGFREKSMARQIIGIVRKRFKNYCEIYAVKVGSVFKYFVLQEPEEFEYVITRFKKQLDGISTNKENLIYKKARKEATKPQRKEFETLRQKIKEAKKYEDEDE